MILHRDIEKFSARNPVVTVGIFDGVHSGHRFILNRLMETARELKGESVLVTLWPHPRTVLNQADNNFSLLNTLEEKRDLLADLGVEHMVVIKFTKTFSRLSSCDFIKNFLVEKIGIHHLVVGYNHRFGRDREGDFENIRVCADTLGFGIEKVPPLDNKNEEISSSMIRKLLLAGSIDRANELLGSEYSFSGEVVGGSKLGTSIGFPTANITPGEKHKLIPANGVYTVRVRLKGKTYEGMLNIGTRPTVNNDTEKRTIEVHLLDFVEDIYSEQIQIDFVSRLRDERRFDNIEALRKQLVVDREITRRLFRSKI